MSAREETHMSAPTAAAVAPAGGRRSFTDLGVNIKILTAVTVAALVAVIVGLVGLVALSRASASAQTIYRDNVASIGALGQVKALLASPL
jgi:methyl-accepting chemotaxis protein